MFLVQFMDVKFFGIFMVYIVTWNFHGSSYKLVGMYEFLLSFFNKIKVEFYAVNGRLRCHEMLSGYS